MPTDVTNNSLTKTGERKKKKRKVSGQFWINAQNVALVEIAFQAELD
jgi:hypothetical protein